MICFDGASHDWHPVLQSYIDNDVFHLIVNIDGNPNHPKSDKVLTRLCPIDPSPYANPPSIIERPIHAGFCGGAGSSFRSDFLSALGSQIYIRPRVETLETYGEYAKFLTSCRMVLNMAKTGPGDAYQIKARVIETGLAKACLLEEKGSPISNHFVPNVDYLEYDGIDSCRNLIWKMGTNPTILQTIADNLHDKIVKNFSADTFWADILRRCGIPTYKPSLLI